jgi:hypothetical protein
MFSNRLGVAKIVVLLQQAIEQRLFRHAPYLVKLQRLDFAQLDPQRPRIHANHSGLAALGQRITRNLPHRRQLD